MAMASPPKVRRSDGDDASPTSEKLNGSEIRAVTGLLHRAVLHGQVQQLMDSYKESLARKETYVPAHAVLNTCKEATFASSSGSMSDAAKRQRDGDLLEWMDDAEVEKYETYGSSYDLPVPLPSSGNPYGSAASKSQPFMHVNAKIPLPKNMSIVEWGRTVCTMDKVKEKNLCYMELATMASSNDEMNGYLEWIVKTYGTQGSGKPKGKITKAVDLAMYLEAICWKTQVIDDGIAFTRQLK